MPKKSRVSQIYIPEGFTQIWDKFMEICDREGSSSSAKVRDFIRDYVRRHEPGNPQTRIDKIMERRAPPGQPPRCSQCDQPATYICFLWWSRKDVQKVRACQRHRDRHKKAALYDYGEKQL